nr:TonB-dependent receptor [Kineobactrum salinum]
MRAAQVVDFIDLGNRISGVRINNAGASDSLNIRGVGSGFNMGFEQAVAIFVDGVYISRSQVIRGGFLDLERIEVLKGPQSTYFGSNAIAGAMSIVTRKPTQEVDGYASALYAPGEDEYDFQVAVGGPLTDTISGRAAIRSFGMDGYVENRRFDTEGPDNSDVQGRVALRYETSDLDVNLRVDYADYDDKNSELQETVHCPPGPEFGGPRPACQALIDEGLHDNEIDYVTATGNSSFNLESVNSALTAAWTLDEHTITSTTGYYQHDLFRTTVNGAILPVPGLDMPSGLPLSQPEDFRSFSQEIRLQSDLGGRVDYMMGLYYDDSRLEGGVNLGFYFAPFWALVPPAGVIPESTPIAQEVFGEQDQSNRSAFAAATINITEQFRIDLGARYSSIRKEAHRSTRAGVGNEVGQVVEDFSDDAFSAWTSTVGRAAGDYPVTERTDDKFMPSVNVQYDLSADTMIYASYSTGFKAGGWNIGQNLDMFEPETVESYEAGIKAAWFDRGLTTNLTVFHSRYDDLQESTSVIDPETGVFNGIIGNVAKARSQGIEAEIALRSVDGLNLGASIGYLDAEYLDYPNAPCTLLQNATIPGCLQDLGGRPKAYAPEWSGSVTGSYGFAITPDLKLNVGAWLYFTSDFYQQASIDPLTAQSGYAKLDLRAAISDANESWEVAIVAKNVTDRETGSYRAAMSASNAVSVRVDRPRSLAVMVTKKF